MAGRTARLLKCHLSLSLSLRDKEKDNDRDSENERQKYHYIQLESDISRRVSERGEYWYRKRLGK